MLMGADAPIPPLRCLPPTKKGAPRRHQFLFMKTTSGWNIPYWYYRGIASAPAPLGAGLAEGGESIRVKKNAMKCDYFR